MAMGDYVTRVIIIMAGMNYPGYLSFKAMKRNETARQIRLLKYWLVLSIVSALSLVLEPLLYKRVPFFPLIKIAVVFYLVYPGSRGFEQVYDTVIDPWLQKNEAVIDDYSDKVYKAGQEHYRNLGPAVQGYVQQGKEMAERTLKKNKTT